MAAPKKGYTVEGGGLAGVRLIDTETGAPLTGRFADEAAAVAAIDAAKKAAAEAKRAAKNDES